MTAAPSPTARRRPPRPRSAGRRWAVPRPVVWLLVALALLAAAGPLAGVAGAHATLVSSNPGNDEIVPTAPEEVSLTFDQPVVIDEDSITVVDPDAKRV